MKKTIFAVFMLLILCSVAAVSVIYYPYVFSKDITGTIKSVERAGSGTMASDRTIAFSFAVAIKDNETGELMTASSEDRQWAVVEPGMCAQIKIFPYPPWDLERSGTFYGARLLRQFDCPKV